MALHPIQKLRALASVLSSRAQIAAAAGQTFGGKRDLYEVLGYKKSLEVDDYRQRAKRNGVANRILKAFPQATWRGGGELIEDDTIPTFTPFEKAWDDLARRLKLWRIFYRADYLSGVGQYSTILLGAPGTLKSPLEKSTKPEDLAYVKPYAEDRLPIERYVEDTADPRFGQPLEYKLKKTKTKTFGGGDQLIHWTRVVHVCEDLEEDVLGPPKLECVWNLLDDLDKVAGGGPEAFWLRANQGIQFDLDPEIELDVTKEEELDEETEKYVHNLTRVMRTRGVTAKVLGSEVADFSGPVDAILGLISASTGIPQRILAGSERGELASTQDRDNWFDQIADRREQIASPNILNPFVDRCIEFGYLPTPKQYHTRWSQLKSMDEGQRADLAIKIATVNKHQGETVVTGEEIRDRVFGFPPMTEAQKKEEAEKAKLKQKVPLAPAGDRANPNKNKDQQVRSKP